jgi:hypothetical protein
MPISRPTGNLRLVDGMELLRTSPGPPIDTQASLHYIFFIRRKILMTRFLIETRTEGSMKPVKGGGYDDPREM